MSFVEMLDNLSLESQVSIGGLLLLLVILTTLHVRSLLALKAERAERSAREMSARIDALMRKLEGRGGRSGRQEPAVVRPRPLRHRADKSVPAARCPSNALLPQRRIRSRSDRSARSVAF